MQNMNELRDCMPLLHNDLSCPVGQHLVPILHSGWHCRSQNGHRLSDNCSSFHCMGLEKTVKNLKQERNSYLKWEWRLWKQDKNNQLRTKEYSCKTILTKFLRALLLVNNTAAFSFIKFWWMSTFILIFTEHLRHAHARRGAAHWGEWNWAPCRVMPSVTCGKSVEVYRSFHSGHSIESGMKRAWSEAVLQELE